MARSVTPNSWADTTAYIAEGSDASAEAVSFGGGQNVKIVDDPRQANLRIRVSKGRGRFYSAVEARQLAERGLSARSEVAAPKQRGWYRRYMVYSAILWIGIVIAFAASGEGSVGQAFVLLLLTPLAMVIWPPMLRFVRNEIG